MSTHSSSAVRSSTRSGTGLQATAQPNPFPVEDGFTVAVTGGVPPYTFTPLPAPPDPPGVVISHVGPELVEVSVPPGTPSQSFVGVQVTDSSQPPQTVRVGSKVA